MSMDLNWTMATLRPSTLIPVTMMTVLLTSTVYGQTTPAPTSLKKLSDANSDFAFRFYKSLVRCNKTDVGNVLLAPYSISVALAMAYLGARGPTRDQMARVLGFSNVKNGDIHPCMQKMNATIFNDTKNYTLKSANRLYGHQGMGFRKEYIDEMKKYYKAPLEEVVFGKDETRTAINDWVERQTARKIKNLFPPGTLDGSTIMVLVNALYFKANWKIPFKPEKTKNATFYLNASSTLQTEMMACNHDRKFVKRDGYSMVELPYAGDDVSMFVILPKDVDGVRDVENRLNVSELNAAISQMRKFKVNLTMPKYTITHQLSLKLFLQKLNMTKPFGGSADFSGMNGKGNIHLDDVIHKTFIDVNEKGTEAAAATAVISVTSFTPNAQLHINHPFLFLIREKATGTILFLGRITDPSTTIIEPEATPEPEPESSSANKMATWLAILLLPFIFCSEIGKMQK